MVSTLIPAASAKTPLIKLSKFFHHVDNYENMLTLWTKIPSKRRVSELQDGCGEIPHGKTDTFERRYHTIAGVTYYEGRFQCDMHVQSNH